MRGGLFWVRGDNLVAFSYLCRFEILPDEIGGSMVFNVTFNNISVISWWSVLLVEVTGLPGSHCITLSHNVVSCIPCHERGSKS